MICKIQPPNPNIERSIDYNERKMDGTEGIRPHGEDPELKGIEDGHVLVTRNVPEGKSLLEEFDDLKALARKKARGPSIRNVTFHMSINPGEGDTPMDEAAVAELADEIMDGLGYADQPYRVYKHTDIERTHYHVVSTRCGRDGKKISDSFERLKLRAILMQLAPKYGFSLVLNDDEIEAQERKERAAERKEAAASQNEGPARVAPRPGKKDDRKDEEEKKKAYVPSFSRKSDVPVTKQLHDAFDDAVKWNFTTFEQLQALLLRRYNVLLEIEKGDSENEDRPVLFGTDPNGKPITPPLYEADLGLEIMRRIEERTTATDMRTKRQQRDRIEKLSRAAAAVASDFDDYRKKMERKGVYVVVSWTKDDQPFGLTYLDRATKCAWKGSETSADLSWLKDHAQKNGWTITKDRFQQVVEKRSRMPSRKRVPDAERKRNARAAAASPAGQRSRGGAKGAPLNFGPGKSRFSSDSVLNHKKKSIYDEEMERLDREKENEMGM